MKTIIALFFIGLLASGGSAAAPQKQSLDDKVKFDFDVVSELQSLDRDTRAILVVNSDCYCREYKPICKYDITGVCRYIINKCIRWYCPD